MDSAYGGKPVVAAHDLSDDPFDALDRKAIESFVGDTGREGAFVRGDLGVCLLPKERAGHHS